MRNQIYLNLVNRLENGISIDTVTNVVYKRNVNRKKRLDVSFVGEGFINFYPANKVKIVKLSDSENSVVFRGYVSDILIGKRHIVISEKNGTSGFFQGFKNKNCNRETGEVTLDKSKYCILLE